MAAGGDAAFFFYVLLVFGVGHDIGTGFAVVGDKRVALVVCWHVCCFAVEVAGCVIVAAIGTRFIAWGVGVPEIRDEVGGRVTAKAGGGGCTLGRDGLGG